MFDRLRKAFSKNATPTGDVDDMALAAWASAQGMEVIPKPEGRGFQLAGKVLDKHWRMETGRPTRSFIVGEEVKGRADLGLDEDIAILVMTRTLKDSLEKKAYQLYTDSLQTTADPDLPEEMRWLAMYEEMGWDSLPPAFWQRYTVVAHQRVQAEAWITPQVAKLLLEWPQPAPEASVPLVMMVMRGKVYLRMQFSPAVLPVQQHAAELFAGACSSAVQHLGTDIPL